MRIVNVSDRQGNTVVMIHDAFKGLDRWKGPTTERAYLVWCSQGRAGLSGIHQHRDFPSYLRGACVQGGSPSSFHL